MTLYRVVGDRAYRQYQPGDTFEARLECNAEQRALKRGAIEVLDRSTPSIQPGTFKAPDGWPFKQEE